MTITDPLADAPMSNADLLEALALRKGAKTGAALEVFPVRRPLFGWLFIAVVAVLFWWLATLGLHQLNSVATAAKWWAA